MAVRVRAIIKPELLVWARENAGLSLEEAAKKGQVKSERLKEWEAGLAQPTVKQLRKMAKVYHRPLAVFYLSDPPKKFQAMHDFRRFPGEIAGRESFELRFEIRRARYRREVAVDLLKDLGLTVPTFPLTVHISDDPPTIGQEIRSMLAVSQQEQTSWKNDYDALNRWRNAIESLGVLVFQATGVDLSEMRGFSISDPELPAIAVNTADAPAGRIFSMMHELIHLGLRDGGLCDMWEEEPRPPEEQRVEVFCNRISGEILVPTDWLMNEDTVKTHNRLEWPDDVLRTLARRYRVSREVILRRLLIADKTTEEFYKRKRKQFQQEYEARDEAVGFALPYAKAISRAGTLFVRLVLDSYHREKITSSKLAEYLDVKLKHLPQIEQAIHSGKAVEV